MRRGLTGALNEETDALINESKKLYMEQTVSLIELKLLLFVMSLIFLIQLFFSFVLVILSGGEAGWVGVCV